MASARWKLQIGALVAAALLGAAMPATAQEGGRTLLQMLFGGGASKPAAKQPRRPVAKKPAIKKQVVRRKPKSDAAVELASAPAVVEKSADSRAVLVVGDFLAGGLADGLTEALAANAGLTIADRSNGSSGLVRQDYYDWTGSLAALSAELKPAAIIFMIGANDRQQMKIGENREAAQSQAWLAEYERRAMAFAAAAKAQGVPVIWVGMPSFKSPSMSADMIVLNDIYRKVAAANGATFVDIWDGFADANGAFVTTGPDINGQPKRLRGDDGINLSKAGRRKVAFFAEKPLLKAVAGLVPLPAALAPALGAPGAAAPAAIPAIDRTPPIALNDPELDGGQELLGSASAPENAFAASVASRTADAKPQEGRADDFRRPADRFLKPGLLPETTGATRP